MKSWVRGRHGGRASWGCAHVVLRLRSFLSCMRLPPHTHLAVPSPWGPSGCGTPRAHASARCAPSPSLLLGPHPHTHMHTQFPLQAMARTPRKRVCAGPAPSPSPRPRAAAAPSSPAPSPPSSPSRAATPSLQSRYGCVGVGGSVMSSMSPTPHQGCLDTSHPNTPTHLHTPSPPFVLHGTRIHIPSPSIPAPTRMHHTLLPWSPPSLGCRLPSARQS